MSPFHNQNNQKLIGKFKIFHIKRVIESRAWAGRFGDKIFSKRKILRKTQNRSIFEEMSIDFVLIHSSLSKDKKNGYRYWRKNCVVESFRRFFFKFKILKLRLMTIISVCFCSKYWTKLLTILFSFLCPSNDCFIQNLFTVQTSNHGLKKGFIKFTIFF